MDLETTTILLSAARIAELQEQLKTLQASLLKDNEEASKMGGPMDSFKEAAAVQVTLGAKREKVKELKEILEKVQILADKVTGKKVILGKYFSIKNDLGTTRYRLVHPLEADPRKSLISPDSPLGKAVMGKTTGHNFLLNQLNFTILTVE
jgi:transcription elongation factor GreA